MNKYKVWDPNDGDEDCAKIIPASSVTSAATKYAEKYDSACDYAFSQSDGVNLFVRKVGSDFVASVIAYGEPALDYGARLLKEEEFE